jgi:hypothetical protein
MSSVKSLRIWPVVGSHTSVMCPTTSRYNIAFNDPRYRLLRNGAVPCRLLTWRPLLLVIWLSAGIVHAEDSTPRGDDSVGVVCHVQVLSDKVPDVSSLEAWKRSFIRDDMTDQEKALAAWRTTVMFQHQDTPPLEYLQNEAGIQDPIKLFNVYGYSFCSVASCDVAALARYAGLRARGWAVNQHSVPEVFWDGSWHMLDASLINYFRKEDGTIAGVEDIMKAVKDWHAHNPGYQGNEDKLREFQRANGWTGWRRGPELLTRCPFYDAAGWWPARQHGWYSTMLEYDGTYGKDRQPFLYEYGYSQGYQVNICLRRGERLTRNWSNKGLHINAGGGGAPHCLAADADSDVLAYSQKYGDLANGRLGNGTLEYDVPLAGGAYKHGALAVDNLNDEAVRVHDPARPGVFIIRMPSSYAYLTGTLWLTPVVGDGGSIVVSLSDNNGLDWKEIAHIASGEKQQFDLTSCVLRRYDYRLKFEFRGAGVGLDTLKLVHEIQHSQRPLPALDQGVNTITFTAGRAEGTITIEGATNPAQAGKQLVFTAFHPEINGFSENLFVGPGGQGSITFPVATPGDMVRLRFGAHFRARDARDGLDYQASFDEGRTWTTVDRASGPTPGDCKYVVYTGVPAGTRRALVRFSGTSRNATGIFNFRIDADYLEPKGGYLPVKVTYLWEENAKPKIDVHVAHHPQETYNITCAAKPVLKSIILELAN